MPTPVSDKSVTIMPTLVSDQYTTIMLTLVSDKCVTIMRPSDMSVIIMFTLVSEKSVCVIVIVSTLLSDRFIVNVFMSHVYYVICGWRELDRSIHQTVDSVSVQLSAPRFSNEKTDNSCMETTCFLHIACWQQCIYPAEKQLVSWTECGKWLIHLKLAWCSPADRPWQCSWVWAERKGSPQNISPIHIFS